MLYKTVVYFNVRRGPKVQQNALQVARALEDAGFQVKLSLDDNLWPLKVYARGTARDRAIEIAENAGAQGYI